MLVILTEGQQIVTTLTSAPNQKNSRENQTSVMTPSRLLPQRQKHFLLLFHLPCPGLLSQPWITVAFPMWRPAPGVNRKVFPVWRTDVDLKAHLLLMLYQHKRFRRAVRRWFTISGEFQEIAVNMKLQEDIFITLQAVGHHKAVNSLATNMDLHYEESLLDAAASFFWLILVNVVY